MDILGSKKFLKDDLKAYAKVLYVQGYAIDVDKVCAEVDALPDSYDAILAYGDTLLDLPVRPDFGYCEPYTLAEIQAQRPEERHDVIVPPYREQLLRPVTLKNKIYGGVYGRIAACVLGKPFERSLTAEDIRNYLEPVNAYPLTYYVPEYSLYTYLAYNMEPSCREHIQYAQADDDISYFAIALRVLENCGRQFTTQDVAHEWLDNIPNLMAWGPSRITLRKLVSEKRFHDTALPTGKEWEHFLTYANTGEEQIDAMIRADAYGLVSPMRPEEAAALAYKDAVLTNRHTGLYACMWVAGCIAAAFYYRDPITVIQCGLEQIPQNSRYAEAIRQALDICASTETWEQAYPEINRRWGHLGHAGTINETAAIINALVHSTDSTGCVDFSKAICSTVMHGWDTDCSAATCGCIAGVMVGYSGIDKKWLEPLHNTVHTYASLENDHRINAFADRFVEMSKR